jgi:hypothetical protein
MANVDVSELLSDPDFVDPIQVITRYPRINSLGEQSFSEKVLNTYGSVQPASYRAVQKLPEAMRVANVSSFFFKGQIVASAPGQYASILVFKGQRYQVQTVTDWSNFGNGYTEGTCIAEVPAP